eukprot:m.221827 g.221827  ORF g.221827 m.221827 type:complete len:145 (-) comp15893_c0_seq1:59-493(-)
MWRAEVERMHTNDAAQTEVVIGGQVVRDEGAVLVAEALKANNTVTLLNLASNNISLSGARALADALRENTTLLYLILRQNYAISEEGATALEEALEVNTTLLEMDLVSTGMSLDTFNRIQAKLRDRRATERMGYYDTKPAMCIP